MENIVNQLNHYLDLMHATGIRFEFNKISRVRHAISIILPCTDLHNWTGAPTAEYAQFFDSNEFFNSIDAVYDIFKIRRKSAIRNMSMYGTCNFKFAYHKINLEGIKFLEILSKCKSLEEFELKIAIYTGQ